LICSQAGEIVLEPPGASPVPVHVALAPFGRGAVGMSVMVTDLSDQKRHEAVLAAETLSKSILEQAADAIVVCDAGGTIIRTSHVAEELCGRNAVLLPFDAVFPLVVSGGGPVDAPTQRVSLREVLEGKTVRGLEVLLRREDRGLAHLLMSAAPLKQDRRTVGCVVTLRAKVLDRGKGLRAQLGRADGVRSHGDSRDAGGGRGE